MLPLHAAPLTPANSFRPPLASRVARGPTASAAQDDDIFPADQTDDGVPENNNSVDVMDWEGPSITLYVRRRPKTELVVCADLYLGGETDQTCISRRARASRDMEGGV